MQRKFNAQETGKKLLAALQRLEREQQPGEVAGDMTKMELLHAYKNEIKKLTDKGYTVQQIAQAITEGDAFKILPKSITEVIQTAKAKRTTRRATAVRKLTEQATEQAATGRTTGQTKRYAAKPAPLQDTGTFTVQPDTDEL